MDRFAAKISVRALAIVPLFGSLACAKAGDPPPFAATVRVGIRVLNTVKPEVFGDNIEWTNNGMGFLNVQTKSLNPQLVDWVRQVGVTQLRYPGGTLSDFFHWQWAVGSDRRPIVNPFDKGAKAYPFFGPDELMDLCAKVGARASITLNVGSGTVDEAAAWVRYNAERHLPVIDYELGNEVYMRGDASAGVDIDKTPEQYIDFFSRAESAIHKVTPNAELGAVGLVDTGLIPLCKDPKWTEKILLGLGDKIDFLAVHNGYAPVIRGTSMAPNSPRVSDDEFVATTLAAPVYVQRNLEATEKLIEKCCPGRGTKIGIHITESGPLIYPSGSANPAEDVAWNRTLASALYQAGLFNVMVSDPKVTSANHLPLCQDVFGALIGSHATPSGVQYWRNIVYYVFQLYARRVGDLVVSCTVEAPRKSTLAVGIVPPLEGISLVDACIFRAPNRHLFVMLLNRDVARSANVKLDPNLKRFQIESVTTLSSQSYKDSNLPETPNAVTAKTRKGDPGVKTKAIDITVPRCSLTCVEIVPK